MIVFDHFVALEPQPDHQLTDSWLSSMTASDWSPTSGPGGSVIGACGFSSTSLIGRYFSPLFKFSISKTRKKQSQSDEITDIEEVQRNHYNVVLSTVST